MITTITGNDYFELKKYVSKIESDFIKENGDLSVFKIFIDDDNPVNVLDKITTSSLFSSINLYLIYIPIINIEITDFLDKLLVNQPIANEVFLIIDKINDKSKLLKDLKSKTNLLTFDLNKNFNAVNWILQYVKSNSGDIELNTAKYLKDNVSKNKQQLSKEIDKLLAYNQKITIDSINLLCDLSLDANVFNMIRAIFNSKPKEAIDTYRVLRLLNEPFLKIVATLTWAIYMISIIKSSNKNISELSKQTKLNTNSLSSFKNFSDKISKQDLRKITSKLLEIENKSKSTNFDADQAIELFFVEVSRYGSN